MKNGYVIESGLGREFESEAERLIRKSGAPIVKRTGTMGAVYMLEEEELFRTICMENVLVFRKAKELSSFLPKERDITYYALLGTLVSVERDAEEEELSKLLFKERAVNLDGLYSFSMADIRSQWTALGQVAGRLLSECESEEDRISLIFYFLDLDETRGTSVRLGEGRITANGNRTDVIRFCGEEENDLIFNAFFHHPEIIEFERSYEPTKNISVFLKKICRLTREED